MHGIDNLRSAFDLRGCRNLIQGKKSPVAVVAVIPKTELASKEWVGGEGEGRGIITR